MSFEFEVVDGVPRCRKVCVERSEHGREVRRTDLEGIKLENWVEDVTGMMQATFCLVRYDVEKDFYTVLPMNRDRWASLVRNVRQSRRGGRGGPTDEQLRQAMRSDAQLGVLNGVPGRER